MIYQQDWLMRQIEAMIQAVLAVALGISANEQTATQIEDGLSDQAKEMKDRVFASGSYGEALCIIGEYVNITDTEQERKPSLRQQLKETKTAEPSARPKPEKQQER